VEASTLKAQVRLRGRVSVGAPLLRLRSDEQLVSLFRAGNEDAFRAIHDRYRPQLLAYVRQTLRRSLTDGEDVLQDVFVRAYLKLRSDDRGLTLRAWLYRIARNACIDDLRRPTLVPDAEIARAGSGIERDPAAESERRETLRRLLADLVRLPEQQRSALLMRELGGMSYTDVAGALGTSIPAVKSLLVRARLQLARSIEARETACVEIRDELAEAHARGVAPNALARRHLRDCACCRRYRVEIRCRERKLAALAPTIGPLAPLAKLLGIGGGTSGSAAGGTTAAGGAVGTGIAHVAALALTSAVVVAGAFGIQQATSGPAPHRSSLPAGARAPLAPTRSAVSALRLNRGPAQSHRVASSPARHTAIGPGGSGIPAGSPSGSTSSPAAPASKPPSPAASCPVGQPSCAGAGTSSAHGVPPATGVNAAQLKLGANSSTTTTTSTAYGTTTPLGGAGPPRHDGTTPQTSSPLGSSGGNPLGS